MITIDKGYAVIYIDNEGETLDTDFYATESLITDYYNSPGTRQWNFYVIIPSDLVTTEELKKKIEESTTYARKFVIDREKMVAYVNEHFPDLREKMGKVKLIKGTNWRKTCDLAYEAMTAGDKILWDCKSSFYRELSMMDTLAELDKLRRALILNDAYHVIFCTHISKEFNLAKQKLEIFL